MRIGGLASGMDTDSIIKQLMDAHRIPLNKFNQKKQLLEWKRDDYRTLNNKILEFRNASFDMKLQSNYLTRKTTSSNESVVTVSGTTSANEGQYTIKINELASGPSITSGQLNTSNGSSSPLSELGLTQDSVLTLKGSKGTATINVNKNQSIDNLVAEINGKSNVTGVKATYDKTMDRLFITSSVTGESSKIVMSINNGQDLDNILKLGTSTTSAVTATGVSAQIEYNGIPAKYESNTFQIAGMTFTAKSKSTSEVNITVQQDIDATVTTIKNFVEKYNSLIDEVNKELSEKRYRDFQPLTSEEKEAMSEDEIKRWEEKARSGMLTNDQMLSNGLNSLRRSLSESIQGLPANQLNSLAAMGISTANISGNSISGTYLDKGKLYIDETKLRKAILDHPDEVMAVFTTDGATASSDGIATRLYDSASNLFKQITEKAGTANSVDTNFLMGKESLAITEQMDRLTLRLADLETRYYNQFTAMEKYINQMNSQSAWLTQQFSQ